MKKWSEVMQWASGFYLCDALPDGWEEWEEEELLDFIKLNPWQPFEQSHSPSDLLSDITGLARSVITEFDLEVVE